MKMNKTRYVLLASALLLAACGNPEKAAQHTMDKVKADLIKEQTDYSPQERLDAYEHMIKEVQSVAKKTKTSVGSTIARGGSVDGVSLSMLQQIHDALAPRAKCYADPSVACLTPFGSGSGGSSASPQSGFAQAEGLVCSRGFGAADKALDPYKINKSAYAKELIQVAFAAVKCDKPNEAKAAIAGYVKADPSLGSQRTHDLLSVLATTDLQPAWPAVAPALEDGLTSGTISGQDAANTALALALAYAKMGDTKTAMTKYTYFTDTLHYRADGNTQQQLATNLILGGAPDDALKVVPKPDPNGFTYDAVYKAAVDLGQRMGLLPTGGIEPSTYLGPGYKYRSIEEYLKPVDSNKKAQFEAEANSIQTLLDQLGPTAKTPEAGIYAIGDIGNAFGIIALARQKLGEADKATALINEGQGMITRLNYTLSGDLEVYQTLLALAQNRLDDAVKLSKKTGKYKETVMIAAGETGSAEKALAIANALGLGPDDLANWAYGNLIQGMAKTGKTGEIDKLVAAFPGGSANQMTAMHWQVVDGLIAAGDVNGAKSFAKKYGLTKDDSGKYNLDQQLMGSKKIASDRGKAEPIIREMYSIGAAAYKAANAKVSGSSYSSGGGYNQDNDRALTRATNNVRQAVRMAFQNGYTNLGIDLFGQAVTKDEVPLDAGPISYAFTDNVGKSDMTKLLMLGQDHAESPKELRNIIDAAIEHLQAKA